MKIEVIAIFVILLNLMHIFYTYFKTMDILHYTNLFTIFFLINYPFMLIINVNWMYLLDPYPFGEKNQLYALFFAFIGWVCFNLPFYFSKKNKLDLVGIKNLTSIILELKFSTFILLIIILIIFIHGKNLLYIFDTETLQSIRLLRLDEQSSKAVKALAIMFLNILVIFFVVKIVMYKNKEFMFYVFLIIYGYITIVLTTSKADVLIPILIALFIIHYFKKNFSLFIAIKYFIICILLLLFLGTARSLSAENFNIMYTLKQFANSFDGMENLIAITSRVNDLFFGDDFYLHYIEYLVISPIPREFWPLKPEIYGNLSIQKEYIPERFFGQNGMVVAPSFVGPMLIDGGIFGIIVTNIIIGLIFLYMYNKYILSNSSFYFFVYIYLFINIIPYLRIGIGIFPNLYIYVSIFVLFIVFLNLIKYYKNKIILYKRNLND